MSAPCTCPHETPAPTGMSRRTLLRGAAAVAGLAALESTTLSTRLAFGATAYTGDVLVVLSLRGGFDGLSCVVPHGDPAYYANRPGIGVPKAALLAPDAMFGLHPAMAPLLPFWQAGTFGAVHAVGQASPTRSHFSAMEEMERAAPGSSARTGWLDRTLGLSAATSAFQGTYVGSGGSPSAFAGPVAEMAMRSVDSFSLSGVDAKNRARWETALKAMHDGAPPVLAAPAATTLAATATTGALAAQGYAPANGAAYPSGGLGSALKEVARLVKAGVGLQAAAVDYGDWDMHAGLGRADSGWMRDKLTELSRALAAFATDLGPAMSGVTLVTLSEFGRRVKENASGGVDHGHGNAVLMLGGGVVGGRVHGTWPTLAAGALVGGDLRGTTDYRAILGEVLQKRCGAGSLSTVFPGLAATTSGVVRARS
ncbi:DUF1501 domain-containing protein [Vallicoccus soli]|uniref:DUF1501 domain-containing protein n=1 Tax=Vallicoccus soli TaxID=2339232 RepID=A0A3A3YZS1_9ACTN|nr:DUF1501 domain-containing protein [Vallicoccus soli]RJK97250.1 DUF1501 domain-containing protein [Vallicoccus soli]